MLIKTIFSGFGGQGVLMMGYILAVSGMNEDKHVTYLPAYGAEVRGGTANCTVVISDKEIASPVASIPDYVVAMNIPSFSKYQNMVANGGTMLYNADLVEALPDRNDIIYIPVPANSLAHQAGSDRSANMVMLGALARLSQAVDLETIHRSLVEGVDESKKKFAALNWTCLQLGAKHIDERETR
ncbi:MAG: 2-oxoacid:acceptor oxidoreductase family protein [Deltaproteobacteria bacterium]|nr:2-oxoacid:acceptor oxidoreductase family protein [Deltaproteobacteria bacterium]